ncbi:MAG: hypothetical protein L0Z53_23505 [Acidobacteriales bacterium]|nr:hypothetical protein [Terriglobales bacterium]
MRQSSLTVALVLLLGVVASGKSNQAVTMTGWVSDGHCATKHMKAGGEACVRKCIAGAEHINPEWKPGGMVFVTEDKQVWKVDNPDALWGHESRLVRIYAVPNEEKRSIKVEKLLKTAKKT